MTAVLCRACFVEPCKAMAKCCVSCCECYDECCECECCYSHLGQCDKPSLAYLFLAVIINFVVLIYCIIAIILGGDQCNKPLSILAILLLVCGVINALFSYYMYHTIHYDAENPLFNHQNSTNISPSAKLYAFFKYDKWMAAYIIFVFILIALLFTSIAMTKTCDSAISRSVFWIAIILFVYLGLAIFILVYYLTADMLDEWCWFIPIFWPCLIIRYCSDDYGKIKYAAPPQQEQTAHAHEPSAPVVVVQHPPTQQTVYAQPVQSQQMAQQPVNCQTNTAPADNVQHPQVIKKKEDNEILVGDLSDSESVGIVEIGFRALGWMTKKVGEFNDSD